MPIPDKSSKIADPMQPLPPMPAYVPSDVRMYHEQMQAWYKDLRFAIEQNQKVLLAKIRELS